MKQYFNHFLHSLPYLVILGLLLNISLLASFALSNLLVQLLIFLFLVIIPAWHTGRMSYVDIGWPLGLLLIGVQVLLFSPEFTIRSLLIAGMYIFAGGRMFIMAIIGWRMGYLNQELPRYQYQRLRWQRRGWQEKPALLYEVASQGLANMSVLALPAILMTTNTNPNLSWLELVAFGLWLVAFCIEFIADAQKVRFAVRMRQQGRKRETCKQGLWRFSRHPNYFAEWMVWNALVLASIPSLLALIEQAMLWTVVLLAIALAYLSYIMYVVLTHYSGAIPAEYYSVQKRPDYADYQKHTPMFFPRWPSDSSQ